MIGATAQFLCDASHLIVSEAASRHASLEHQALRASWLSAIAAAGMTEDQAREAGRGLWQRAPLGHWTASVTDDRPTTRWGHSNARVLRIPGTFRSEDEAVAAAERAIAAGWVADHMNHRETAKAHADFWIPQEEINRIGRDAANAPSTMIVCD